MELRSCFLFDTVSPEVIDEIEALRQRDIEMAAYQPEPVKGLDLPMFSTVHIHSVLHMYMFCVCMCMCAIVFK